MKKLVFLFVVSLVFFSCSHRVVRTGYDTIQLNNEPKKLVIKKLIIVSDSIATKVGEVRLGDSGFSTSCNEADAIGILKGEAYSVGADIIIITEERRPDALSSCYRCSAEFYKYNSPFYHLYYESDSQYASFLLEGRVKQDRRNQTGMIVGTLVGTILGILLISVLL